MEDVMKESVYAVLANVRRRQRGRLALRLLTYGLVAGSLAGVVAGAARFLGRPLPPWGAVALLAGGPLLGGLIGFLWRGSWRAAAAAVDRHYRLKDRSVTALEFLANPAPTDLQSLQIADAAEHLRQVDPQQVVPWRWPGPLPYACAAAAAALALLLWPLRTPQ